MVPIWGYCGVFFSPLLLHFKRQGYCRNGRQASTKLDFSVQMKGMLYPWSLFFYLIVVPELCDFIPIRLTKELGEISEG